MLISFAFLSCEKPLHDKKGKLVRVTRSFQLAASAIPLYIATNVLRYSSDQRIALDKQKEELLQTYLNQMTELLLKNNLRISDENEEVRYIARAYTMIVLSRLDSKRKKCVLEFLYESELILWKAKGYVLRLAGANLIGADLRNIYLNGADLTDARLASANLTGAHLSFTKLDNANLRGANLSRAYLNGASLIHTNLNRANLRYADLYGIDLKGAHLKNVKLTKKQIKQINPEE